jgi:hypothetical protein
VLCPELPKEIETIGKKKKTFRCSLSFHRVYMSHEVSKETKVCLNKSPHPCLHKALPLVMQTLLVALEPLTDRVIFKLQAFIW